MTTSGSICLSPSMPFAATRKRTRGPSRTSERTCKPWIAAGISPRTYYRRKAAAPQQQRAHVDAWLETLSGIARLEHRAFMRRCLSGLAS